MTHAEMAVLTLIAEQPRHGYEIEQLVEARGMREWTGLGFSSIYYVLKKLEQEGQIEGRLETVGRGPARKVYHLTPAGSENFRAALLEAMALPHRTDSPFRLALANLSTLPREEVLKALQVYRETLMERRERVRERWERSQPLPPLVEPVFDYSLVMIEAELGWVSRFIERFEGGSI